jgi:hypothetical protein
MLVILCHPDDRPALWLARSLTASGVPEVTVVSVEELVYSRTITYRMSGSGDTGTVRLGDGRVLRPESIGGLVNRIRYLPTRHFARANADDRAYATAELSAFLLAWLSGIPGRVLNPARPFALGGGAMYPATIVHAAATAGLAPVRWQVATDPESDAVPHLPPTHTVTLLDHRVYGPLLPREVQDGCRRLLGLPLLQVMLHHEPGSAWRFVDATPSVDFRTGGDLLTRDLARVLRR